MNSRLGKGGTFLLGVFTCAAAFAVVATWYNAPKGKLRATIAVNGYATPPKAENLADFKDTTKRKTLAYQIMNGFMAERLGAYLSGQIENGGSKDVKQVTLRVPGVAYSCVQRESSERICRGEGSVAIGDLSPLEAATVQIWLRDRTFPSTLKDIRLTHSEGVGRVDFAAAELPKGFMADNAFFFWMFGIIGLFLSHGLFAEHEARKRVEWVKAKEAEEARKKDAKEKDDAEQHDLDEALARQKAEDTKR
jgi:hypothetical protein